MTQALCATQRCSRPTQTMLCGDHLDELVEALQELAHAAVRRHTRIEFDNDGNPIDKRVIVPEDDKGRLQRKLAYIPADLARRPGLLEDLQDTVVRTDNTGPAGIGRVSSDTTAVQYHEAASALADTARNTITTWARDLHEHNPHLHLPGTLIEACEWMAGLPQILAIHPAAGELHEAIVDLHKRIERMVDARPDLVYLGICSAPTGDGECTRDLYCERDADVVQCRECGEAWETYWRRQRMLAGMEEQLLTATNMRTVLSRYMPDGAPAASTIRWWASIGKLTRKPPHPDDPRQDPRYRVGDVLDLISEQDDTRAS